MVFVDLTLKTSVSNCLRPLLPFHCLTDEDEVDVVGVSLDKTFKTVTSKSDTTKKTENYSNEPPPRKLRSRRNNNCDLSEQESDEGNARISHNDLERKRRNDLRNRFQCLRKCIPLLEDSERVAKITILRRASELIPSLRKEEERLIGLKNNEKKRNAELLNKLMKLTKNKRRQ